jgi:hypothetical protein
MRRTMFMLVFMGTMLALAAGVALAQDSRGAETSRGPVDFFLDSTDCHGELISVTGKLNAVFHVREDEDGSFHANSHFNFANVKGIGELTRVEYTVPTTVNSTQHITSAGQLITTETTMSLTVGQGQAPNQQATTVIHLVVAPDGTVKTEVVEFRFECRS